MKLLFKIAALSLLTLTSWEAFWTVVGVQPAVRDEPGLWAALRREAGAPAPVVLIGTSRTHTDLDPAVLEREIPGHRFLQLAINGSSPLPVLEDLAADPNFQGTVVCEFVPWVMFDTYDPEVYEAAEFLKFYRREKWGAKVETALRVQLQSRVRLARPDANLWTLAEQGGRTAWNAPRTMTRDRFERLDFSRVDREKAMDDWVHRTITRKEGLAPRETTATLAKIAGWSAAIERRGGQVIFVRMVVSGKLRETEDELYPRSRYWDVFVRSQKSPSFSFEDFPTLARFECPDGSHLDYRDTARFTGEFARVLNGTRKHTE